MSIFSASRKSGAQHSTNFTAFFFSGTKQNPSSGKVSKSIVTTNFLGIKVIKLHCRVTRVGWQNQATSYPSGYKSNTFQQPTKMAEARERERDTRLMRSGSLMRQRALQRGSLMSGSGVEWGWRRGRRDSWRRWSRELGKWRPEAWLGRGRSESLREMREMREMEAWEKTEGEGGRDFGLLGLGLERDKYIELHNDVILLSIHFLFTLSFPNKN